MWGGKQFSTDGRLCDCANIERRGGNHIYDLGYNLKSDVQGEWWKERHQTEVWKHRRYHGRF